mgnify:CR=1 FL=1
MSQLPKQPSAPGGNEPERGIAEHTRTLVVGPYNSRDAAALRPEAQRLEEAVGLAQAIDLAVVRAEVARIGRPRPATLLGLGKVEEFKAAVESEEIDLVLVDGALSPVQQRNLERAWGCKVIDRTGLILEIFGRRARTREGVLQVELAHLAYQKSRLVRSWTHLERQRGGFGFLGGPGETQIEADRRMIVERMRRIEHDLEKVKRTRALHRAGRDRVPYPTIALVGYTNAGKSTLFNRLSSAEVLAKDMLFATLDPTARVVALPHGLKVILLDTVGFISDLPTTLIAAFRATLEDVIEADVILHVRDLSHQDTEAQAADVAGILTELGIDPSKAERLIEVWNKTDRIAPDELAQMHNLVAGKPLALRPVLVSALSGAGLDILRAEIERRITATRHVVSLLVEAEEGAALHWLYETCEVLARTDAGEGRLALQLRIPEPRWNQFARRFAGRFTTGGAEDVRAAR